MKLGTRGAKLRRGEVVYATHDIDDVPAGARGVVVDVYPTCVVVAFRWGRTDLLRCERDYVDGEKFLEVGPEDISRRGVR